MARRLAMATPLLCVVLLCVALASLTDGRQVLAETSVDSALSAHRSLLSKNLKDSKSAPDCSADTGDAACEDDDDDNEVGEEGHHDEDGHHDDAGKGEHDEDKEGNHEEGGEGHEHDEGEEGHEHGEEEGHHEGEEDGHHHEEHDHGAHDHGHGGNFVELLGEEPATDHAFELVGVAEGGNMTKTHIVTLLDTLQSGEAQVDESDSHGHSHGHGDEEGGDVEVTSWLLADDLLATFGGGRPVLTEQTFTAACPTILACQLDPTCALGMGTHGNDDESDEEKENLDSLKAIVSGILLAEVLLGYGVPYAAQYLTGHLSWYISLLNTFSGGIILATGLVHLVPDVIEEQFEVDLKDEYPLGMVMMTVGFLLVFFVEQVLFGGSGCPHHDAIAEKNASLKSVKSAVLSADMELKVMQSGKVCTDKTAGLESRSSLGTDMSSPKLSDNDRSGFMGFIATHRNGVILMIALVVHSMLEGIVVGFQDERDDVILFFSSIAAHKLPAAMALSARFLKTGASFLQAFPFLLIFGLMGPISVLTGTVLNSVPAMVRLVLNGLSAGTFVYIGAYEVVQEEFAGKMGCSIGLSMRAQRVIKFLLMALGVTIISLIALVPHEHE